MTPPDVIAGSPAFEDYQVVYQLLDLHGRADGVRARSRETGDVVELCRFLRPEATDELERVRAVAGALLAARPPSSRAGAKADRGS